MQQGISAQQLNFTATENVADHVHTGNGVLVGLKDLRFVRLYDSVSGYAMSPSFTAGTVFSVDLTTADFRQLCYVGYEQKRHNSPRQFVFAAGASGYRRIEIGQSTGGAGAIVSTNSAFAIRAMVYDSVFLYLWDYTNGKIQKVNNPNDLSATALVLTDFTANGTVPVASFTGRSNFMTYDGSNIWCIEGNKLFKITSAGTVTSYTFATPGSGRAVLWDGKYLWVSANGALKRVLSTDTDPANNGVAVGTGVAFNAGDVLGTDGDLVYAGLSTQTSGLFSIIVIDPDSVIVVQDIQGVGNPFNMATTGIGANRRVTVGTGLTVGGVGAFYALHRHAPGQLKSLRTTGARFKNQKTILYGSGNYYVGPDDHIILVSDNGGFSSGAVTINFPAMLPNFTGGGGGREIIVIDMAGTLGGGNTITLAAAAGETINGAASVTMTGAFAVNTIWYVINPFAPFNAGTGWVRKT